MKIDKLTWDKYIYPRTNKSKKTIEAYAEAIGIGAEFPPIEVQKVINYPTENGKVDATLIIDGVHRWLAYQKCEKTEIEIIEWKAEPLDYETHKIELGLEASDRNTKHGNRVNDGDRKMKARQTASDDPERKWTEEQIAEKLHVSQQRVNEWISDIRARQKAGRDSKIIRLARLGWAQKEIEKVVELDQGVISRIMQNTDFGNLHNLLSEGRTMDYIADHYSMDLALVWALRLDKLDDKTRFDNNAPSDKKKDEIGNLGWRVRIYDYWNFDKCDPRFGDDWPGRIPAQLVAHTLFFFTEQGDLVLDPMAGGGVVPDTCLAFNRKCRAFDIVTRPERPEIQFHYWQLGDMQWPASLLEGYGKKPNLVFVDPPYFSKKKSEYEKQADDDFVPISSLSRLEYLEFFKEFFSLTYAQTKPETRLAFLNADWRDFQSTPAMQESPDEAITIFDYYKLLDESGWQTVHRIECPMSTQRFTGSMVTSMQKKRILGTVGRTLMIARKK